MVEAQLTEPQDADFAVFNGQLALAIWNVLAKA
jgi:hypothetical protein